MHYRRIQVLCRSQKDALQHLLPIVMPQHCINLCRERLVGNLAVARVELLNANETLERDAKRLGRTRWYVPLYSMLQRGHACKICVDIALNCCGKRPDAIIFFLNFFSI
jgi:hypothetical protein